MTAHRVRADSYAVWQLDEWELKGGRDFPDLSSEIFHVAHFLICILRQKKIVCIVRRCFCLHLLLHLYTLEIEPCLHNTVCHIWNSFAVHLFANMSVLFVATIVHPALQLDKFIVTRYLYLARCASDSHAEQQRELYFRLKKGKFHDWTLSGSWADLGD